MNDIERVVIDIKKSLSKIKYEDEKLDIVRKTLSQDIIKYLNDKVTESEKKEKTVIEPDINQVEHNKNKHMKTMRYRLMKERNK